MSSSHRVDFSGNAPIYDRRHGAVLPADVARRLVAAAGLSGGAMLLDIGAGTGRVAIALAALGCRVAALEPASGMLASLREKTAGLPAAPRIGGIVGEGARLPFADASFDAVVLARVLYLMSDWRAVVSESVRVLKSSGAILFEWGNGSADEPWVRIREKARELFERAGVPEPFHPGARRDSDVLDALQRHGFETVAAIKGPPDVSMTLAAFLDRIASGELSYIWKMPEPLRAPCIDELRRWAAEQFDLDREVMPGEINWRVLVQASLGGRV